MTKIPQFKTQYLNDYLAMVEDTESPRIFHIWSAIYAISCALGRRCWFPLGPITVFPNHYVVLVGTPGTRKSTVAGASRRLLRESTGVRFAPTDTGGQRQGLIRALAGGEGISQELLDAAKLVGASNGLASLTDLEDLSLEPEVDQSGFVDVADKHCIAVVASELSRLIGQNNMQMLDFLGEVYDGSEVSYLTKQSEVIIEKPLMNLLACTTPVSIAHSMPPAAGGQGILSRMILVYGAKKYKLVPRPSLPSFELVSRVKDTINNVYYQFQGSFTESDSAREFAESSYGRPLDIADSRFAFYAERRDIHLLKLGMCLAAASGRSEINRVDYEEADRILRATERGMPDALGEFGMNPLATLKQEIIEQLRASQGPMTFEQIVAMFHRDARSHEITEVVNDLVRTEQIKVTQLATGQRFLNATYTQQSTEDAMLNLLAEGK